MRVGFLKILNRRDEAPVQSIAPMRIWGRCSFCLVLLTLVVSGNCYAKQDEHPPKPIFKLVKGQGVGVCEAYLERLNKTEFLDNNPTKGRVNEPLLKGFVDLKPVPLTEGEIKGIILKINSFELNQDQDIVENFIQRYQIERHTENLITKYSIDYAKDLAMLNEAQLQNVKKYIEQDKKAPFVRYQTKLDLDNNGVATDTVIKNNNSIYIVENSLKRLDQAKMLAILADQEVLRWPSITKFPPLAAPITVFGYQGKYYFDGFQNLEVFRHFPALLRSQTPMLLKVFSQQNGEIKTICEYQWLNAVGIGIIYRSDYQ